MSRNTALIALLLSGSALACGGESREHAAARRAAQRDRCIAEELAVQANTQLSALDTLSSGAGAEVVRQTLYPFARAAFDFAKARERELALLDSALAAPAGGDSAGLAARAAQARPRTPATPVEANAARDYQRRFAEALGNPAHPCNVAAAE